MRKFSLLLGLLLAAAALPSPGAGTALAQRRGRRGAAAAPAAAVARDVHSYSNPAEVRVRHVDLDWDVLFDQKMLRGTATLAFERAGAARRQELVLDTRNLGVTRVEASQGGAAWREAQFTVGAADAILGAPLTIQLPPRADRVRVHYSTSPTASGLQWLDPAQTAGKRSPFMFTQSQAIHARSWIPLQDTPGVRVTYTARVRTPRDLLAVMSAENEPNARRDGDYHFRLTQPVPSYLIALAVGDLRFRATGRRTGVYAEPSVVERAAREFADTERMVAATERLYGPYRWGRYDILVLPPSFPFGGMENPRLTFATPTVIAGDKSLVSLIAHELAHSWSGNLVTNATWRDFWLNEGFTTYLERRILEEVYGRERAQMEAALGLRTLEDELKTLAERDEILHVDLSGRDPDEGFTQVPYEKGALFLRHLEETFGRARFDQFVRGYFDRFAFQSITTEDFARYLRQNLTARQPRLAARVPVEEWIERPGLPASAPRPASDAFARVEEQARRWLRGDVRAEQIQTARWTTHEWLHFLKSLPEDLGSQRMAELDRAFRLTRSGNSEVAFQWLLMSIRGRYEAAYPRLEEFLTTVGRRKFLRPLYEEMAKTPEGRERARAIYRRARPGYHPIAVTTIDQILQWQSS
jgi:leukotriene-A4 hydrolase